MNEQHVAGSERLPPAGMSGHRQGSGAGGAKRGTKKCRHCPELTLTPPRWVLQILAASLLLEMTPNPLLGDGQ